MKPKFTKQNPLLPAIVQDAQTLEVLMLGYMNASSYRKTVRTGRVTFYSRSRKRLWTKGETSGNSLRLVSIHVDCDGDSILVGVIPAGPTCHTGKRSCFHTEWNQNFLFQLERIVSERWTAGDRSSYVRRLRKRGIGKTAQKVIEEAGECALAFVDRNRKGRIAESADLVFHLVVLLQHGGLTLDDVARELRKRHRPR